MRHVSDEFIGIQTVPWLRKASLFVRREKQFKNPKRVSLSFSNQAGVHTYIYTIYIHTYIHAHIHTSSASLPWDIRALCARYLASLRHVSAACRLNQREECQLIAAAMAFEDMRCVVQEAAKMYDSSSLKEWCRYQYIRAYACTRICELCSRACECLYMQVSGNNVFAKRTRIRMHV